MKNLKEICNGCGFPRIIVNKKYGMCNVCNHERIKKLNSHKPTELPELYSNHQNKRKSIRKKSLKRIVDERKYIEIRERKRDFQKEKGIYRCFFCNAPLIDTEEEKAYCHHAMGRDGDLFTEWSYLFFAHFNCHSDYHDKSVEYLMKTKWYLKFIDRLERFNRDVYNQELRRLNKAGIVDDSQFLKMYKPEKQD